jgi:hypothetical protein
MPELTSKTAPSMRPSMLVLSYPLDRIDFRPWACSILAVERLEDLHLRPDPVPFANYVGRLNYYKNLLADNFAAVVDQYLELASLVAPLFDGINLRQNVPSFRCHLAGAGSASDFHRDGDPEYRITPGVINGWLPLTPVGGRNSLYIEVAPGSEDYRPVSLQPGEILIFDAYHLKHGSYANDTRSTRVSFDFRFLPKNPARARELGIVAAEPGDRKRRVDHD